MTKELPTSHRFKSKLGVDAEVEFVYPRLPDRCTICSKWGHLHTTCRAKVKILTKAKSPTKTMANEIETSLVDASQKDQQNALDITGASVQVVDTTKDMELLSENLASVETTRNTVLNVTTEHHEKGGETEDLGWKNVSPSKMCRSGGKDHVPDPKISSPSRFAVLDVEEGQVDMGEGNDSNAIEKDTEEGEFRPEEGTDPIEEDEVNSKEIRGNDKAETRERLLRSAVHKPSRGVNRNISGKSTLSTKDTVPSVGGKRKNHKKH